jgi:hypothetical protein
VNGREVAEGVRARRSPAGRPLVNVAVRPAGLVEGLNRVVVKDEGGRAVGDYELNVRKR